jgi:hypothetical protein
MFGLNDARVYVMPNAADSLKESRRMAIKISVIPTMIPRPDPSRTIVIENENKKNAELEVRMSMRSRGDMKNATSDPVLSTPFGFLFIVDAL